MQMSGSKAQDEDTETTISDLRPGGGKHREAGCPVP